MTPLERAELRRLIDKNTRLHLVEPPKPPPRPRKCARYLSEAERDRARRAQWRAYYYRNRELRKEAERERYWRKKAEAA